MAFEKSVLIPIGEVRELHQIAYSFVVGLNIFVPILVFCLEPLINAKLYGNQLWKGSVGG